MYDLVEISAREEGPHFEASLENTQVSAARLRIAHRELSSSVEKALALEDQIPLFLIYFRSAGGSFGTSSTWLLIEKT